MLLFHTYMSSAVVLLDESGHDGRCYDVARPVGGAAGGLQQLGAGPHQLQVRLRQVMSAVWDNVTLSVINTNK